MKRSASKLGLRGALYPSNYIGEVEGGGGGGGCCIMVESCLPGILGFLLVSCV